MGIFDKVKRLFKAKEEKKKEFSDIEGLAKEVNVDSDPAPDSESELVPDPDPEP